MTAPKAEICFNTNHINQLATYELSDGQKGYSSKDLAKIEENRQKIFTESEWKSFGQKILATSQELVGHRGVLSSEYFQKAIQRKCPLYIQLPHAPKYLIAQGPRNAAEAFRQLDTRFPKRNSVEEIEIPVNFTSKSSLTADQIAIEDSVKVRREQNSNGRKVTLTILVKNHEGKYELAFVLKHQDRKFRQDINQGFEGNKLLNIRAEMSNRIDGSQSGGFASYQSLLAYAALFPSVHLAWHPIEGLNYYQTWSISKPTITSEIHRPVLKVDSAKPVIESSLSKPATQSSLDKVTTEASSETTSVKSSSQEE